MNHEKGWKRNAPILHSSIFIHPLLSPSFLQGSDGILQEEGKQCAEIAPHNTYKAMRNSKPQPNNTSLYRIRILLKYLFGAVI
jgi:hypothetical protein